MICSSNKYNKYGFSHRLRFKQAFNMQWNLINTNMNQYDIWVGHGLSKNGVCPKMPLLFRRTTDKNGILH